MAFQSEGRQYKDVLPDYRLYLDDYVYEKLWSELSETDTKIAKGIAEAASNNSADIRTILNVDSNKLSQYRRRLIRKQLVSGEAHGTIEFTLPLFDEFVKDQFKGL